MSQKYVTSQTANQTQRNGLHGKLLKLSSWAARQHAKKAILFIIITLDTFLSFCVCVYMCVWEDIEREGETRLFF